MTCPAVTAVASVGVVDVAVTRTALSVVLSTSGAGAGAGIVMMWVCHHFRYRSRRHGAV